MSVIVICLLACHPGVVRIHAICVVGLTPADLKAPENTAPADEKPASACTLSTRSLSEPRTPATPGGGVDRWAWCKAAVPVPPPMTSANPSALPQRWVGRSVRRNSSIDWKPLSSSRRTAPPHHTDVITTRADVTPSTGPNSKVCARPVPESSKSKVSPRGCSTRRTPRTRALADARSSRPILETPSTACEKFPGVPMACVV
mmetsp:Transcript_287/g.639  ORF Transcript_287/g.639 Transcript_287/m.639 type:complete len:202 (+) Transcript_287:1922-2527(+)